jgi:DNA-binding NtrC family response regulator
VTIEGETGSGRALVARTIHDLSPRRGGPFLVVDAGVQGPAAAHARLFGGGEAGWGALRTAQRGSVLVRSLECLEPRSQAVLAAWLRTGTIPDGPHGGESSEARLLGTVGAPLGTLAATGRLSADLLGALAAVRISLAPLRERPGDPALLLEHFLREARADGTTLDASARTALDRHPWPGNVAEVRALAALLAARGPFPGLGEAALLPLLAFPRPAPSADGALDGVPTLRDVEIGHIVRVLALAGGVRSRAAKALGISPRTIYNHLRGRPADGPPPGRAPAP